MNLSRIKRIKTEIEDLFKNKLDDNFIFYDTHDNNIEILKVLIIGTDNTPYKNGFFFFTIKFSENYPFGPPKVWFYTTNPKVRMNPNLYNNGKVCLSIINTWGNQDNWTSLMSVRSVLLSIQSMVLCDNPLKNEPGLFINKIRNENYNNVVKYCVTNIAILEQLSNVDKIYYFENNMKNELIDFSCFNDIINKYFVNNINTYIQDIKKLHWKFNNEIVKFTNPYEPTKFECNYIDILKKLSMIYESITEKKDIKLYSLLEDVDLKKLTVKSLIRICKNNKIKNYSGLRKQGIIDKIKLKNEKNLILI